MRPVWLPVFLAAATCLEAAPVPNLDDNTVSNQWFTGSLLAPSPALPKAGIFAAELYTIYAANTGVYDGNWGYHSASHNLNQLQSLLVLKYAITDRLTIQALPSLSYQWTDQTTSHGVGFGDLPVELEYKVSHANRKTGWPSLTFDLGMTFPTGEYDRLQNPLNGVGSGAYTVKEGILLQSLFDTWGNHPMRLRLFGAAYEAVANVSVHDVSVYGTDQGFQGNAEPGISATVGLGVEYGLNQRWVLALDLVQNYTDGFRLNGIETGGNDIHTQSASSSSFVLAPAIEYNWSANLGLIVGVQLSAAGRNTSAYVAPQVAVTVAF